jgi:iron complex transport system ATP-binding protein
MPLISLINAGYKYPGTGKWVFRHFDMAIESGEVIRVTGPNGSGKTTLLKVLSGLLALREGQLQKQSGTKIAYMDQFAGEMLARDLTIYEQFKAASSARMSPDFSPVEMLNQFEIGLQDRLNEFIGHLSGGQRQIVALLCVLAAGASVLCLDEFTSSMDENSARIANELLSRANTTNVTLVLVSHIHSVVKVDRELQVDSNVIKLENMQDVPGRGANG